MVFYVNTLYSVNRKTDYVFSKFKVKLRTYLSLFKKKNNSFRNVLNVLRCSVEKNVKRYGILKKSFLVGCHFKRFRLKSLH